MVAPYGTGITNQPHATGTINKASKQKVILSFPYEKVSMFLQDIFTHIKQLLRNKWSMFAHLFLTMPPDKSVVKGIV